jgi:phosphoribosylaminoimidazolecarboxamide formyltransferase / IMP cyclohydrolase
MSALSDIAPLRRALLSVFDKTGIVEVATALHEQGVELLSTGGTARLLAEHGLPITEVGAYTGFPEMMDGRVKTLHPKIHGGLLGRRDLESHQEAMKAHGIGPIDLVVVNLYPFEQVARKPGASWDDLIENIDIGGPSMLRSAAKNHDAVTVLSDPSDYEGFLEALRSHKGTKLAQRRALALKVYARTAAYDAAIAATLEERAAQGSEDAPRFAPTVVTAGRRVRELRYGENPHQGAAVYATGFESLDLAGTDPLQGKELSYNNLLDADAALFSLRCLLDEAGTDKGVVVIKHGTPCGAARAQDLTQAWRLALSGDPVSAFGGIVCLGAEVTEATATAMADIFLEVVVAPSFSEGALALFAKKKNLRLLALPALLTAPLPRYQVRSIPGGLLMQDHDRALVSLRKAKVVSKRAPTDEEWAGLDVAFRLCTAVRSNAITLARGEVLVGAGGGQTSRVDAVRIALDKARAHGHETKGTALGSDAFFPFPDGVEEAARAGVTAVAQPGGSKKDDEVIAAADAHGIAMVMTDERHFRH